jgi:hypothetical protein
MPVELLIAGLTGGIQKMLVVPGRELYDIDAYIDDEFGENDSDKDSMLRRQINSHYNASTESTDVDESVRGIDAEKQEQLSLPVLQVHERGHENVLKPKVQQQQQVTDDNTISTGSNSQCCNVPEQNARQVVASTLDPDTDPFAPRSGKALLWRNVNMTLVRFCCCFLLVDINHLTGCSFLFYS